MKASEEIRRWCAVSACMAMFWTGLLCAAARAQEPSDSGATNSEQPSTNGKKSGDRPTVKLRIRVRGDNDKPVSNASVYVRYTVPAGLIHNERLAELDLKTNGEGSARVPA